jgi:hypothetical protein
MDSNQKLLEYIMMRKGDTQVPFGGLCRLLRWLGFSERVKGDHHIFTIEGVEEIINLQPRGNKAKPYQVKQVRGLLLRHGLQLREG